MATVRIYKVAELLGLSSQDAMSLLKEETGIDVKSASSSIEEIVARQFVERQARKRGISLPPPSALFAETATKRSGGKAPEPPKPAGPVLRPRLVKTHRPADHPAETGAAETAASAPAAAPVATAGVRLSSPSFLHKSAPPDYTPPDYRITTCRFAPSAISATMPSATIGDR